MDWTRPCSPPSSSRRAPSTRARFRRPGRADSCRSCRGRRPLPVSECPAFRMRRASTRRRPSTSARSTSPTSSARTAATCARVLRATMPARPGRGWTSTACRPRRRTTSPGSWATTTPRAGQGTPLAPAGVLVPPARPTPLLRPRRASWRQRRTILRSSGFKPPCAGHRPPARRRTPIIIRAFSRRG